MHEHHTEGRRIRARVFAALETELKEERLGVSPQSAQLYRKKEYYSRERDALIVTDISLEVFLPGKQRPSLIWIFEAKDYKGHVPVNDVEEFHAKLQQIGADNTKGTMVLSGALQMSALNYARSQGIGVVRLLPSDQVQHVIEFIVERASQPAINWSEFMQALVTPGHRSRREFFAMDDNRMYSGWQALLSSGLQLSTMNRSGATSNL